MDARDDKLWLRGPGAARRFAARAFGLLREDLDVDFAGPPRPVVVTELLRRCLRGHEAAPCGEEEIWSWTVPQRSQALIAVALASGEERLRSGTRCPHPQCGEIIELDVEVSAFLRREDARDFDWSPEPERIVRAALPTGADQREWLDRGEVTLPAMTRQLLRSIDGQAPADEWVVPESWVDGLATELAQRDPLTALELEARCPACGTTFTIEFDLEAQLLERLQARQEQTLRHIHELASAYHWSEDEIVQLPTWRRHYYLRRLGVEER